MFDILFPAWITGMVLSLITAPLGAFVVWRKMAYFGDTLSHSALLGVALGIFLQINPYIAILVLTILLSIAMVCLALLRIAVFPSGLSRSVYSKMCG